MTEPHAPIDRGDAWEGDPAPHVVQLVGGDCGGVSGNCPQCTEAHEAGKACRQAAYDYLARGLSVLAICPPDHAGIHAAHAENCQSPGKRPLGKWAEFQDRLPTKQEIKSSFRPHFVNVGIALGPVSGLVRIDVDGAGGEKKLAEICGELPPTWEFSSGGGGRGLLFRIPDGVTIQTTTKRDDGGLHQELRFQAKGAQTVMPPSRHVSGRRYAWKPGCSIGEIECALLPPALVELMRVKPTGDPSSNGHVNGFKKKATSGPSVLERARLYLDKMPAAISEQGGHRDTMDAARVVVYGFDLGRDVGLQMLLQHYNPRCQPPWTEAELRHKCEEADTKDFGKPRGWLNEQRYHVNGDAADPICLTDVGNGKRFAGEHGAICRYCHPWGKWLIWDGARWRPDDAGQSKALAKKTVLGLYAAAKEEIDRLATAFVGGDDDASKKEKAEKLSKIKAVLAWALKSQDARRIGSMLDMAKSEPGIPVSPDELDSNAWLFNCTNGTLDLQTGKLKPHDQEDYITKLAPVPYDPAAACPTWQRFLIEILKSETMAAYKQRLAGYWLTGRVDDHVLPVLWGVGANGKSTEVNTLFSVMGPDYAGKAHRDLLLAVKGDRHPTALAWLHGKRFVACIETGDGARLDEPLIKELTGADEITARRMREDHWSFRPTHKICLVTNHRPSVRGTDLAIWRRLRLIPYTVAFPEDKQDKKLPDKLQAELPGVLAWMVEGCLAWQRQGLADPPEVREATAEYRTAEDQLGEFLAERCTVHDGVMSAEFRVKKSDLYTAFREWSKENGAPEMTGKGFGQRMAERGFERDAGKRYYLGLTLIDPITPVW